MQQRNPFPGMNPWMERFWQTVHHGYIYDCQRQIARQLPDGLFCEAEETVYVVEAEASECRPDVAVLASRNPNTSSRPDDFPRSPAGVATPVLWRRPVQSRPQRHISIRSLGGDEPLVTVLEVISPTNKFYSGSRRHYLRKRRAYFDAGANVVEVDLLRRGKNIVGPDPADLPTALRTAYRANVSPAMNAEVVQPEGEYYPLSLREKLPRIRIPLRVGDDDIALDLQEPVDSTYEIGRYWMRIDYSAPLKPPLSPEDAAWAADILAAVQPKPKAS